MISDPPRILLSAGPEPPYTYRAALEALGLRTAGGYCPAPDLTCDGLVLCGGGDLESTLFGQENQGSDPPDLARDKAELELFHAFYQAGKPILGICRGMQVINVALGGDLIQDLPAPLLPFHRGKDHNLIHLVRAQDGSLLHRLYGQVFPVNSYHHQAVGKLGRGLRATAWAEGGFAEALEHDSLPILGVQFHPERMAAPRRHPAAVDGGLFLTHFADLCRAR